jgi:hypothetical protein
MDFSAGAGREDFDFQPFGVRRLFCVTYCGFGPLSIRLIDEHSKASGCGHQLTQEFQPLCRQLTQEKVDTCRVAARPR